MDLISTTTFLSTIKSARKPTPTRTPMDYRNWLLPAYDKTSLSKLIRGNRFIDRLKQTRSIGLVNVECDIDYLFCNVIFIHGSKPHVKAQRRKDTQRTIYSAKATSESQWLQRSRFGAFEEPTCADTQAMMPRRQSRRVHRKPRLAREWPRHDFTC